jgi:hypothetical protein
VEKKSLNCDVVGFIWQKIPTISQYKLKNNQSNFIDFCDETLNDYKRNFLECFNTTNALKNQLKQNGCSRVVVVPEAVGSIRTNLFEHFLSDIPEYSFVMVSNYEGFGNSIVLYACMDLALKKNVFLITPEHRPIINLPIGDIKHVYLSWVRNNKTSNNAFNVLRKVKMEQLLEKGFTSKQIQVEMGISKSTYYRILEKT